MEKLLTLTTLIFGAVGITLTLPELMYYAAPMHVILYTTSLVFGLAGVRAVLKSNMGIDSASNNT